VLSQHPRWDFARSGHPSQPGLQWEPFDPTYGKTMMSDNDCRIMSDPEGEVRRLLLA
jgi:para-nitrobenzyl esterase